MCNPMRPGREVEYNYPHYDTPPQRGWIFSVQQRKGRLDIWVETQNGELIALEEVAIRFLVNPHIDSTTEEQ